MALSDLSFKLYTDSSLTVAYTGTTSITHETDLSDNDQDFLLYFGSTASSSQLQTSTNPGVDNITLTPTDLLPDWEASTAYSLGVSVQPTTPNTYRYECTTAGTSAASEPTWPTAAIGNTVTDGTVVWTLKSAKHATTEIKLASTSGGLSSATAGAALSLGHTISSGTANKKEVHIRITNAVTTVGSTATTPEIGININSVTES